ncbi:hypothetical protein EZBTHKR_0406 [Elizabethkingia anophelis]|nr:hypothetical protein EZBTHKR_0406 [Elizabethkingia anophelis]
MIRESEHAQSKSDFIHKLSIAQKEINEDAVEIIKLITSIIKTTKNNINN